VAGSFTPQATDILKFAYVLIDQLLIGLYAAIYPGHLPGQNFYGCDIVLFVPSGSIEQIAFFRENRVSPRRELDSKVSLVIGIDLPDQPRMNGFAPGRGSLPGYLTIVGQDENADRTFYTRSSGRTPDAVTGAPGG